MKRSCKKKKLGIVKRSKKNCHRGSRRSKKTGKCEPYGKSVKKKIKTDAKTVMSYKNHPITHEVHNVLKNIFKEKFGLEHEKILDRVRDFKNHYVSYSKNLYVDSLITLDEFKSIITKDKILSNFFELFTNKNIEKELNGDPIRSDDGFVMTKTAQKYCEQLKVNYNEKKLYKILEIAEKYTKKCCFGLYPITQGIIQLVLRNPKEAESLAYFGYV
jgi:hypothetical protein